MAGLLDIRVTKKVTATCSLEESTAKLVDRYAAWTKASADEVVNKALEYVFTKDKDFQQFIERHPNETVTTSLRVKKSTAPAVPLKRGRPTSPAPTVPASQTQAVGAN